jgi:hypothetical protein
VESWETSTGTESRTQTVVPKAHPLEMTTRLCNQFLTGRKITGFLSSPISKAISNPLRNFGSYQVFKRYQLDEEQVRR